MTAITQKFFKRSSLRRLGLSMVTLLGISGTGFLGAGFGAVAAEVSSPKNVLELFTSQGCHSCPPADVVLGKHAKTDDTLALAWHVDYWDYLGWKDIFASKSNTERQYAYATSLRERRVYTPQAVVNGRIHMVGSSEDKINKTLEAFAGTSNGLSVPISVQVEEGQIDVSIEPTPASSDTTLFLVYFDEKQEVDVERGENAGKKLVYHNIVRKMEMLGMVKGKMMNVTLPLDHMKRSGYSSCALILQKTMPNGGPGPIVGAAVIKDLESDS